MPRFFTVSVSLKEKTAARSQAYHGQDGDPSQRFQRDLPIHATGDGPGKKMETKMISLK